MTLRPRVRTLLAGLSVVVLMLPILASAVARVFDNQLVRQTEEVLLTESVVIGEAYRQMVDARARGPLVVPEGVERFNVFPPVIDLRDNELLGPAKRSGTTTTAADGDAMSALLERTVLRNLTGARVLDRRGTVIASPQRQIGYSLAHLPEVDAAMRGGYAPQIRRRYSDEPAPPLASLSRAADIRVSLAIPIYEDPLAAVAWDSPIIGVVYSSRTPLDRAEYLWLIKDELYYPVGLTLGLAFGIVLLLATFIARPLSRLRRAAVDVAAGKEGVSLDVTGFAPQEVHELSTSLATMRDQLERRAEYVQQFAANTAHELKTPLTSLRGAAELILDDEAMPPDRVRRFLTNIHADAVRMDSLVQRILQLARIEASRPSRRSIDLEQFIESIVEQYARRDVQVKLRFEAEDTQVLIDPDQFESLITNLIDNAVRHGEGAPVELTVDADRRITVRDYGPPLPADHFDHIFDRFYSTERNQGGTGLGLSIVRAVAEAHGGSVAVQRHDRGASFIVILG